MISFKHIKLFLFLVLIPFKVLADNSVGTVNGSISVNEMGAAIYSVPFEIFASGTGFDPQIGVAYNSQQSGYGNVGYGVNITGISAITRAGKDLFHDNRVQKIQYDLSDTYLLDGKRLIIKDGLYGSDGAVYTIEGNPYVTITQKNTDGSNNNTSFTYTDANGITYIYNQRRICSINGEYSKKTIGWYISKAINKYGDSIVYKYMTDCDVLYPSEITYGRNGERHKVRFIYAALTKPYKFVFEGGKEGYINRRLTRVTSYNGNSVYRRYDLSYNTSPNAPHDESQRKYDRLIEIKVYNSANEALAPLTFNWQYLKSATFANTTCPVKIFDAYNDGNRNNRNYEEKELGSLFSADLNGDGISDIVRICQADIFKNNTRNQRTFVYIARSCMDSKGKVTYPDTLRYDMGALYVWDDRFIYSANMMNGGSVGDIDGDGINDLILPTCYKGKHDTNTTLRFFYILGKDIANRDIRSSTWIAGNNCFGFGLYSKCDMAPYLVMDLNGDGKDDILYLEQDKKNYYYNGRIITEPCNNFNTKEIKFTYTGNGEKIKRIFRTDCNADGVADVVLIFDDGYKIYYNNGVSDLSNVFYDWRSKTETKSDLKDYWRMEQGDFDGDGLLDFACSNVTTLDIFRNNGNGTFSKVNTTRFSKTYGDDGHYAMRVADFDKDGISDLMISNQLFNGFDGVIIQWYVSHGINIENNTLELEPFNGAYKERDSDDAYEPYIFSGDFDGDGYTEIANYGSPLNKANDNTFQKNSINIYKFPTDVSLGRISSIENGFGKTTKITYASGTDSKVYKISSRDEDKYPVNTYTVALPLVSQVEQSNGAAGTQQLSYSYGDMKIHVKGRGMLGFASMTVNNTTLGSKTETKVTDWDNSKYLPISVITTTTIGDKTSETQITNTIEVDDTWNGNYFSYCKEKLSTDFDDHQIKTKYSYNLTKGVLTDERNYYDGKTDMYKNTKLGGHFLYAGKYLPTTITYAQRHSDDSGNLSKVTHNYTYDKGEIVKDQQVSWYGNKSITLTTTYTRDDYGNVLTEVTSGSKVIAVKKCYEYDDNHLRIVKSYTDPASVVTTYKYDSRGNLISMSNETDASNILSTTYTYDKWDNLIKTVNPDGTSTSVSMVWDPTPWVFREYDDEYMAVTTSTAQAPVTVYYDSEGREVCSSTIGLDGVAITKVTQYDSMGNVSYVENTTGDLKTFSTMSYDAFGRLTSQTNSDGSSIKNSYNDRTVTTEDPTGTKTKTYDAWGNIKEVKDALGNILTYYYNSNGQPSAISTNNNSVTFDYDAAGRRIYMNDPDAGEMKYSFAADGTLLSQTDARGVTTNYSYDNLGRLKTKTYVDKSGNKKTQTNEYAKSGRDINRLKSQTYNGYKRTFEYDSFGKVTSETRYVNHHLSGPTSYTIKWSYNPLGQMEKVTYPGTLSDMSFNYSYDNNGFLKEIKLNNSKSVYSVKSYNGLILETNTVAGVMKKTVDEDGYLQNYKLTYNSKIIDAQTFTYDKPTGNLYKRIRQYGGGLRMNEQFAYDNMDRLVSVYDNMKKKYTMEMSYDDNGNINNKSDVGTYAYNANSKPHAVISVSNDSKNINSNIVTTDIDLNGKIGSVNTSGAGLYYLYGPDDEKWMTVSWNPDQTCENDIEHLYFDGYEKIIEDDVITEQYFLENGVIVISKTVGTKDSSYKVYQAVTDNLGSIVGVYDEHHEVAFRARYDVWGKQTVYTDKINFQYGYTGHEMLTYFGLIDMGARLYDPALGRFLSCDNYVQEPDNTQNFNRYSYCINNPLKYTDPSGNLFGIDDVTLMFAAYSLFTSVATAAAEGQNVWKAAGMSLLTSVASYGLGCATSAIGSQLGHGLGTFGTEMARAGAHGLVNGAYNAITGNSFGSGFATGFVSSLVGSGTQALGWSSDATLSSMFIAGGLSSLFTGGDFLSGAMTGYSIGALNHTWEEDGIKYSDENDPRYTATGTLPEFKYVYTRASKNATITINDFFSAASTGIGGASFRLDRAIKTSKGRHITMGGSPINPCPSSVKTPLGYKELKTANKMATGLKIAGWGCALGSAACIGYDIAKSGHLRASHVVDGAFVGLGFIPAVGWAIGGSYFLIDMGHRAIYNGQSIGQHIDSLYGNGGVIF